MKKQLPTDAISNELAQSVFFSKPPTARPHQGTDERPNGRTVEQANTPPLQPSSNRTTETQNERTIERVSTPPTVLSSSRSSERPNGRADKQALPEKTERYSFEIYPSQKERMEEYLYQHKRKTKEKISASRFIRQAIDYYFKTLK